MLQDQVRAEVQRVCGDRRSSCELTADIPITREQNIVIQKRHFLLIKYDLIVLQLMITKWY